MDALLKINSRVIPRLVLVGIGVLLSCRTCPSQTITADSVLLRLIDEVDVPARALGALSKVHVAEGHVVEEGQELGRIDDTEVRLDYQRAKFELEIAEHEANDNIAIRTAAESLRYAQAHYDRLRRAVTSQPNSVSDSELDKARLETEKARLEMEKGEEEKKKAVIRRNLSSNELAVAERNVEVRSIVAPQGGVIANVLRRPGEWVQPGEKIFRIVSTKRLRAEGFIQANQVPADLKGKRVTVSPQGDADSAAEFSGKVIFVSPEIDPVNGQVRILADVENPDGLLRPGLRVQMSIHPD